MGRFLSSALMHGLIVVGLFSIGVWWLGGFWLVVWLYTWAEYLAAWEKEEINEKRDRARAASRR